MQSYQADLNVLLSLLICGAYWANTEQHTVLLRSFKRIADQSGPESGTIIWLSLRRYPALVLMYGLGLGALANSNYRFLKALFDQNIRTDSYKPEQHTATALHNLSVLERDHQRLLPGREREHTPLSNHLFQILREPLRQYLPDDSAYDAAFDWFEYLLCLVHCDQQVTRPVLEQRKSENPDFPIWAPMGRFCWKGEERNIVRETDQMQDGSLPANILAALQAGFCEAGDGTRTDKYLNLRAGLGRHILRVRQQWGIF